MQPIKQTPPERMTPDQRRVEVAGLLAGSCASASTMRRSPQAWTPGPSFSPASDGRLTISVPIQIKRRSGRKL
jgi:hypothetical protein